MYFDVCDNDHSVVWARVPNQRVATQYRAVNKMPLERKNILEKMICTCVKPFYCSYCQEIGKQKADPYA